MSKAKKSKVPKITEAEYAAYLSALKEDKPPLQAPMSATNEKNPPKEQPKL